MDISEIKPFTPKKGDIVWVVVNDNIEKRWFVEFRNSGMSDGCLLAFESDLKRTVYYTHKLLYRKKSDLIKLRIGGLKNTIRSYQNQLDFYYEDLIGTLDVESVVTPDMLERTRTTDNWHHAQNINSAIKYGLCKSCNMSPMGCEREGCGVNER